MDRQFICKECKQSFIFNVTTKTPQYCPICKKQRKTHQSRTCSLAYYYRKKSGNKCPICGSEIPDSTLRRKGMCRKCRRSHPTDRRGEKASQWKGGKVRTRQGYIYQYAPTHPNAVKTKGYVLEHRLVWEMTYNKILPKEWVVHHINGIRDDNRPQNLYACSNKEHTSMNFLKILQSRIRSLEKEISQLQQNNHLL